jgi:glutathione S-transferase kappa 1
MHFSGNKPPIAVANKGMWMQEDMQRASKFYGVTLKNSPKFPVNTMGPQGLLRLMTEKDPQRVEAVTDIIFNANWNTHEDVQTPEQLKALVGGLYKGEEQKLDQLLAESQTKAYRTLLKEEAKALADDGAFGMPWMYVTRAQDGKTGKFFGSDRFEQIAAFLEVPYKGARGDGTIAKL